MAMCYKPQKAENQITYNTVIVRHEAICCYGEEVLNHRGHGGGAQRTRRGGRRCKEEGLWCRVCGGFTVEATVAR